MLQTPIASMISFLEMHAALCYLVCFWGSYFETLIPFSFYLYGELFFLPGAILAGAGVLNIWLVTFALMIGGALGDSTSYLLGARFGERIFLKNRSVFSHRSYRRGEDFFHKHGVKGVFFARLLGPLSWVTPFLAGTCNLPYRRFIRYNLPGVVVGIGKFIVIGYYLGSSYRVILSFLQQYIDFIVFAVLFLLIVYHMVRKRMPGVWTSILTLWRQGKKKFVKVMFKHAGEYMALFLLLYLAFLYQLLFLGNHSEDTAISAAQLPVLASIAEVRNVIGFTAFSDPKGNVAVQPVNLIVVTKGDLASLFVSRGWIQDIIFSRQRLTPLSFWRLWEQHTPPVSDLYINGRPQDFAFQNQTDSSFSRLHVRFWKIARLADSGAVIYAGSVSLDRGIDIVPYAHFFVPLHAVNPDVDSARERIRLLFKNDPALKASSLHAWGTPKAQSEDEDEYYTDGRVLVLKFATVKPDRKMIEFPHSVERVRRSGEVGVQSR